VKTLFHFVFLTFDGVALAEFKEIEAVIRQGWFETGRIEWAK
jgi:hypothetical protein